MSAVGGCSLGISTEFRLEGGRMVVEFRRVEEDFVRVWLETFPPLPIELAVLVEKEFAEALRRWRDVTTGGLDRSFFTGSGSGAAGGFARRFEADRCSPPVEVGLLIFARGGGGRIEALLEMLPVALGGRDVVDILLALRVGGFTGKRLGD